MHPEIFPLSFAFFIGVIFVLGRNLFATAARYNTRKITGKDYGERVYRYFAVMLGSGMAIFALLRIVQLAFKPVPP